MKERLKWRNTELNNKLPSAPLAVVGSNTEHFGVYPVHILFFFYILLCNVNIKNLYGLNFELLDAK